MRLTLRVLLAYLDNILEPADAATVEAKIAESETVSTLVHHIREISKRVRIPAPEILGKGLGLDPNTVAEYLDYGLSDDAVRNFESVCMQSNVHMAEVAACHEILSLVLVKPAEIDPAARQRMYGLLNEPIAPLTAVPLVAEPVAAPAVAAGAAALGAAAQRAAAAPTTAPAEPRRKAEVPSYLRQPEDGSGRTANRIALAVAALFALVFIGGLLALKFVPHDNLPKFMQSTAVAMFDNRSTVPEEDPEIHRVHLPAHYVPSATATGTPLASGTAVATGTGPLGAGPLSTGVSTAGLRQPDSALTPAAAVPAGTGAAPMPPVPAGTVIASGTPVAPGSTPGATTVVAGAPTMPASGTPTVVTVPPTTPGAAPAAVTVAPAPGTTVAVVAPPVPRSVAPAPQPAKVEPVGKVSSDPTQVILRYDARAGWVRLRGRDVLMVGDRLLALPAYRPQITLGPTLAVDMLGGTEIELLPIDAAGVPGLRLLRGRLTMVAVGAPQAKFNMEVGNRRLAYVLSAAELAVALAFHRPRGLDPAAGALPWSLTLIVKNGEVAISDDKGSGPALKGPGRWLITGTAPLEPLTMPNLPLWISTDERDLLEKQAADFIETGLREDKAVNVALEEIVDDRRIENQQLALRCLAQLGDFNDFTPLLRDPTQRWATWEKYLELLSDALDYGPYHAERPDAFIKQQGPTKGTDLYRMLWGYNDDQLKQGVAKGLVEALDHDDLDFRILAFWNLTRITGLTLNYLPQDPPLKRKTTIVKWQQKLDAGQIVYKKN